MATDEQTRGAARTAAPPTSPAAPRGTPEVAPRTPGVAGDDIYAASPDARPIPRAQTAGAACALSFAQQRIWLATELALEKGLYNVPWPMRIRGPLDPAALRHGLDAIVRRHAALRTAFVVQDGEPRQQVLPDAPVPFTAIDLHAWPEATRQDEARRLMAEEARRPFDFAVPPMLRALLIRIDEGEHLLLMTAHHIAADGVSGQIVRRELAELYAAARDGRDAALPELPIQYADYAVWQRTQLTAGRLAELIADGRARLAGAPALELPADRPRPAMLTFRGARRPWQMPAPLADALQRLGRRHGVTLFTLLLAVFKTLLLRHTGQTDLAIGVPVANRTRAEIEPLIGCFINTLVIRTDLRGDPTFRELLARARRACTEAYAQQDLPFEQLVEALQPDRDLSRHPLVQITIQLLHTPSHTLALEGAEITPMAIGHASSPFDLSLLLFQTEAGLDATVEYSTDLFDPDTIDRLVARYERLLWSVTEDADLRLSELPVLAYGEQRQMLADWNATAAPVPADALHTLIEAQAARTPDAVALADGQTQLSYAAVNRRANQLARRLRRAGVGPDVRVGICLERTPRLPIALLAVLKAGGAYVPLDPAHPVRRIRAMLAETRAVLLLAESSFVARRRREAAVEATAEGAAAGEGATVEGAASGGPLSCATLCLDLEELSIANEPGGNLRRAVPGDALAYVIHTSGSTGRPKGVAVPHRAVVNFLQAMREQVPMDAQDVMPFLTAMTFDIAGLEIFLPWTLGARIALCTRAIAGDAPALLARLRAAGVTIAQATPATWRMLTAAGWRGDPAVRVLCGGEALPRDLAAALTETGLPVWNLYGPTETTIWSVMSRIERGDGVVPIGRPIANTAVHVLDAFGQLAPVGVSGELHIGGQGVARGYLHQPALTAERFVPDAFSQTPGARLYRTGDLVQWRPDGQLLFHGRRDHQIKLRGFRLEPGEIEHALRAHESVRDAVVIVREDEAGDRRLVAYVCSASSIPALQADALWRFLLDRLPDYMVPAEFIVLPALPLSSSGKVDRAALPAPARPAAFVPAALPPRTTLERAIAGVWQEVLQLPSVGLTDRFFAMGGNSLLLVRVLDRLRSQVGLALSLTDLFRYTSIQALAQHLSAASASSTSSASPESSGASASSGTPTAADAPTSERGSSADVDTRAAKQAHARQLARQRAANRVAS